MIRQHVKMDKKQQKDRIRWRSHEVGRIEAFTDAVFAFAVTLLIVSLEVPKSFEELTHDLFGFIPFGLGFMFLFWIWGLQHQFFRRYGLFDAYTNVLNAGLIFIVLFFVYPLKFLAHTLVDMLLLQKMELPVTDMSKLMIVYGSGYIVVFLLLALMYRHALVNKEELELTESEVFETTTVMYQHIMFLAIGVVSVSIAIVFPAQPFFSGIIYAFTSVPISMLHRRRGRLHKLKFENKGA